MLTFEWDENKAERNLKKHGVSFLEAQTIFYDLYSITAPDPDHSEYEDRFVDIGMSNGNLLLVVVYTERRESIRIISARRASPAERKIYEQEN